jgi:hypothetical protein
MRTDEGLEGWMLVNFIALSLYYKIYAKLLENNLLTRHSVADVLQRAAKINKMRINEKWDTSEIALKTQKLPNAIACPVT